MIGLMPPAAGGGTGASGAGSAAGGGGGASIAGRTQPVGVWAAAAAAAAPHIAAAGAPPLIAVRTAQGLTWRAGTEFAALAAVALNINEPATNAPIMPLNALLAMSFLRSARDTALAELRNP